MAEYCEGALSISEGRIWSRRITGFVDVQNVLWPTYGEPVDVTEAIAVILAPYIRRLDKRREGGESPA